MIFPKNMHAFCSKFFARIFPCFDGHFDLNFHYIHLNDYMPIALTSHPIKVFENVLSKFILALGLNLLDPVSCRGLFALFALARRHTGTLALGFMLWCPGVITSDLYCCISINQSLDSRAHLSVGGAIVRWIRQCMSTQWIVAPLPSVTPTIE